MLKKIRVALAILFFTLITLLFLDFTGTIHTWFGWMARVQLVPAVLAVNAVVIVALVVLTLLFGRVYCSAICPLGVFQDIVSRVSGRRKGKKNRFRHSRAKSWLRYGVLGLFIVAVVAKVSAVVSILDPYAAYGRIASNTLAHLYRLGNNLLAFFAERAGSYAFYSTEVWMKGWITLGIAIITLVTVGILAWRNGRTWCNTICPVGTVLGFVARFSLFRPVIDEEKCTGCKACERGCKASCIDAGTMSIDRSRCVTCFNCTGRCKQGAIRYAPAVPKRKTETKEISETTPGDRAKHPGGQFSRRDLLSVLGMLVAANAVRAQQLQVDGGLAEIEDKKIPVRKTPIVPPGAQGARNMKDHCTACQLCVGACPNSVLRPSGKLATLMQPEMSFERGYCRPECVECSLVCPAGAIKPVTAARKSAISVGLAVWIKDNCVVNTDEVPCDNCERHCPTGAITLVARTPGEDGALKIPVVDKELCTGCGACENLCPARPFSAIYVEGNVRHHSI